MHPGAFQDPVKKMLELGYKHAMKVVAYVFLEHSGALVTHGDNVIRKVRSEVGD